MLKWLLRSLKSQGIRGPALFQTLRAGSVHLVPKLQMRKQPAGGPTCSTLTLSDEAGVVTDSPDTTGAASPSWPQADTSVQRATCFAHSAGRAGHLLSLTLTIPSALRLSSLPTSSQPQYWLGLGCPSQEAAVALNVPSYTSPALRGACPFLAAAAGQAEAGASPTTCTSTTQGLAQSHRAHPGQTGAASRTLTSPCTRQHHKRSGKDAGS